MVILGLDPGTTRVGYGVIRQGGGNLSHVASGLLSIPSGDLAYRLSFIYSETRRLIDSFRPERAGVEALYFFKNQKTAIEVAEARGVLLLALSQAGITICEVTPLQVKLGVAGSGGASKKAVAEMVFRFLSLPPRAILDDATDALAVAIAVSGRRVS